MSVRVPALPPRGRVGAVRRGDERGGLRPRSPSDLHGALWRVSSCTSLGALGVSGWRQGREGVDGCWRLAFSIVAFLLLQERF